MKKSRKSVIENRKSKVENPKHYSNEKRNRYANGDIWCEKQNRRLDRYTCIAITAVHPDKCVGCTANL